MKNKPSLFDNLDEFSKWSGEWAGMPEFVQEDLRPIQRIVVNFETKKDVDEFSKLIGQKLTYKTDTIWFPHRPNEVIKNTRYVDEP